MAMRTILEDEKVNQIIVTLSPKQAELFTVLRSLILDNDHAVSERLETGKWLHGYLKYDSPNGNFVYALGAKSSGKISLHAMTYYASPELQQKYGDRLTPFLSGKSCFDFGDITTLPAETLKSLFTNGSSHLDNFASRLKDR